MEFLSQMGGAIAVLVVIVLGLVVVLLVYRLVNLSLQARRIRRLQEKQSAAEEQIERGLVRDGFTPGEAYQAVHDTRPEDADERG